jgi:transposase-like protein
MVAESLAPGASVSKVAQRYSVNANLLFTWRCQETTSAASGGLEPLKLLPVTVADEGMAAAPIALSAPAGRMEIALIGERVVVGVDVDAAALIARLRLEIEKLRRRPYGVRSERKERLIDQLEMQLDAGADATEDDLAAERAAPSTTVKSFERNRPARKPFPGHLPRERVVVTAPPCCS